MVWLLPMPGTADVHVFRNWAENAERYGVIQGYRSGPFLLDQPPLGFFLFWLGLKIGQVLHMHSYAWPEYGISGFKLLLLTLHVFMLACVWYTTRRWFWVGIAHFALTLNSLGLGYFDLFFAPFLWLALWKFQKKQSNWALVFLLTACLAKWQPMLLAPFALIYAMGEQPWKRPGEVLRMFVPAMVLAGLCVLVFGPGLWRTFHLAATHRFLSGNALNANWLFTYALHMLHPEQFGPLENGRCTAIQTIDPALVTPPRMVFYACYSLVLLGCCFTPKTFSNFLRFSLAGYLAYFTFNTGVHENHLIPALIVAMWLTVHTGEYVKLTVAVALLANFNPFLFYGFTGLEPPFHCALAGLDISILVAAMTVALTTYALWRVFLRQNVMQRFLSVESTEDPY